MNNLNITDCKKLLARRKLKTIEDVTNFEKKFWELHDDYVQINKCYGNSNNAVNADSCKELLKKHRITSAKRYESFIRKYEKMMYDANIALKCFVKINFL